LDVAFLVFREVINVSDEFEGADANAGAHRYLPPKLFCDARLRVRMRIRFLVDDLHPVFTAGIKPELFGSSLWFPSPITTTGNSSAATTYTTGC
jgi:hypothetical protein